MADEAPSPTPAGWKPIITSWAAALRPRAVLTVDRDTSAQTPEPGVGVSALGTEREAYKIDTRGKTRAQIKAEEYEKACGGYWRDYQSCLKVSPIKIGPC